MRFLSLIFIGLTMLVVLVLSVANRQLVRFNVAPDFSAYGIPTTPHYEVPLFVVALACGTIGFILGAAREYLREARLRREAKLRNRELGELRREVDALKGSQKQPDEDDDLLLITGAR